MTRKACVVGFPVKHSLSPVIHGYWIAKHGIDGAYDHAEIHPDKLMDFIQNLRAHGYIGANITIPHKVSVIPLMDRLTDTAREIGAVNTIWYDGDELVGDNSDQAGFFDHLTAAVPDWQTTTRSALVIGAGGAARAIVTGLATRTDHTITIANRTLGKAKDLANELAPRSRTVTLDGAMERVDDHDLIINTSALGMTGQPALHFPLDNAPDNTVVADIVFAPLETDLLKNAREKHLRRVDGLGMLLHQATRGFEAWFGMKPVVDEELRATVIAALDSR